MKEGYLLKSAESGAAPQELALINQYTRRELTAQEVYLFTVVLCDNEIDRDYERFTRAALEKLAALYVGKTGIFDHNMKSENQRARIFSCKVEPMQGKVTQAGEPYYRLTARAYMPRTTKNEELIEELECGIKKEVSVGCSVGKATCSVCGADLKTAGCTHIKGKEYGGSICHAVLEEPADAYEWSFVAVPAQREAGVIKAYDPKKQEGEHRMEEIIKSMQRGETVTLSGEQTAKLAGYIRELEQFAQDGREYRGELQREVVRLSAVVQPELTGVMGNVVKNMALSELRAFQKAYAQKAEGVLPPKPQLMPKAAAHEKGCAQSGNAEFKI